VFRTRTARLQLSLISAGVTAFALANHYYVVAGADELPFPSLADIGYLLFYPLILAGLAVLAHRQRGELPRSVLVDGAVGSLGAASVLAVLLSPILPTAAMAGRSPLVAAASLGYPLFDLLLVSVIIGIAAARGLDVGRLWTLMVLGLLIFAATDVVYAFQVAGDTYVFGAPLDAGWAVGLTLIALWACDLAGAGGTARRPLAGAWTLTVPAVATLAGLAVLILGTQVHVSALAVGLAGVTLVLGAVRTLLVSRQIGRMAELRRQAMTDDLTGLPNRRALYAESLVRLAPGEDRRSALLLLDLDRFKELKAKAARSGHHVFIGADDSHGDARLRLLEELRAALASDQLILHYQPKIDLITGDVRGVEALVRWNHPQRSLLYPDAFLTLVEEAGLMRDLTRIVLGQALDQALVWRAQGAPP
jgi:hypothetical protein